MDFGLFGFALIRNMKSLDIDPNKITRTFVSHGHADHIWGLKSFVNAWERKKKIPIYLHPYALNPKWAGSAKIRFWNAGYSQLNEEQEKKVKFIFNTEPIELIAPLFTSGEIPLNERTGPQCVTNHFVHFVNGRWEIDPLLDDQSLVLKTKEGLVLISGDCHAGVVNLIAKTKETYNDDIYAIVGSLHLMEISNKKLLSIVDSLKETNSHTKFYLNHTISRKAWYLLRKKLGKENIIHFRFKDKIIFEC